MGYRFFLPVFSFVFLTEEVCTDKAGSKREKLSQTPGWYYISLPLVKTPLDSTLFLDSYFPPRSDSDFSSPISEGIFDIEFLMNKSSYAMLC